MKTTCPNCQASGKDEHHDEIIVWVGQKSHQQAVITAGVTLFLAFLCLLIFHGIFMVVLSIAVVLFIGWRVRKSFESKSNLYQCNKCEHMFPA